jgi:hypothetical protein
MEQCWSAEPMKRPLLGFVLPLLQSIQTEYALKFSQGKLVLLHENKVCMNGLELGRYLT